MRIATIALALLLGATGGSAFGQAYPNKPVRVIVPFPAGGGVDIVARIIGQKLTEDWKQQVVVENRGGAGGVIGTDIAASAAPDGYTLMLGTLGNLAVNPHLYQMRTDPIRDFAPITQVVNVHFAILANPGLPANSVRELIALAKAKKGEINYSSSGAGGAPHLAGELLKSMAGIDMVHVPYKGSGPSVQDVMAGQVQLTFDSLVQALPLIKDGKLKALAVLGRSRSPLLPEVPTVDESGVPGYDLTNWFGLVAPAAVPKEILAKLHDDVVKVLAMPDIREKFAGMGADAVGNGQEQFGAFIRAETDKWAKVIKEAGIKAD